MGKILKSLRGVAGVSQGEEPIYYSDVLFDLLNESGTPYRELEPHGVPISIDSRLAYPSIVLNPLHSLDRGDLRNTERRSDLADLALRMPVKIEQYARLERREP